MWLLALAWVAAQVTAQTRMATAEYLTDYVSSTGARCLDGTPYQYWVDVGPEAHKFVLDWQGGAWCQSISDCADRAYGPGCFLGSSSAECFNQDAERCHNKTDQMAFSCIPACDGARWCGGLMQDDPTTNPLSHNWTHVLFPYCDGGSAVGDNETVTYTNYHGRKVPLYFRGLRNLQAALSHLVSKYGLGEASDVILTGNSAGGLNNYYHMDRIAQFIRSKSPNVNVHGAPDSGFFFSSSSYPAWGAGLAEMVEMMNGTGGLHEGCVAAEKDPLDCRFPEVTVPYISTPYFVMNSKYDPALDGISFGMNQSNASQVNSIGQTLVDLVQRTVMSSPANAAFLTSCAQHCGQWAQGSDLDFNVTIDGFQAIPAMQEWMKGGRRLWIQPSPFPCTACCRGG